MSHPYEVVIVLLVGGVVCGGSLVAWALWLVFLGTDFFEDKPIEDKSHD
jgi:hypothetical protein